MAEPRRLADIHEIYDEDATPFGETMRALVAIAEASRELLNNLDDSVAGADLKAWDAAYLIEATSFGPAADRLREALSPFREIANDGF